MTDAELRLMRILWARHQATVGEVLQALPARNRPAYNTVLTILRILEQKGYVAHEKHGRAFVYRPILAKIQVRRRAVRQLLERLFDNSPSLLVLNVLEDTEADPEELERLRDLVSARSARE